MRLPGFTAELANHNSKYQHVGKGVACAGSELLPQGIPTIKGIDSHQTLCKQLFALCTQAQQSGSDPQGSCDRYRTSCPPWSGGGGGGAGPPAGCWLDFAGNMRCHRGVVLR